MFGAGFDVLTALPLFLGPWEILLALGVLVLFFGGRKIPEFARGVGTGIRNFRRGLSEGQQEELPQLPEASEEEVAPES